MEEMRMSNKTKRTVVLFMIYCLISVAAMPLSGIGASDGGDRGFGPMAAGDPWTDSLDDTSNVYVPPAGLVGIEVSGGDAHLKAGDSTGWIASEIITVPDGYRYDLVLLDVDTPGNSYVELSVLNASADPSEVGFANESIGGFKLLPISDLSIYSIAPKLFPKIRIQVNLHADGADRPRLLAWTVYFIGLEEWRDDFMGAGKMSDHSGLNFTGDILEVNLSSGKTGGGGVGEYEAFPPIVNPGWDRVDIFYPNAGNTGYQDSVQLASFGSRGAAFGHLNGDGLLDLVLANTISSKIFWGRSSGTYDDSSSFTLNTPGGYVPALGDFDGDGWLDIAFACFDTSAVVDSLVFLNNGDGTFNADEDITYTSKEYYYAAAGDVNGDGYDDVVFGYTNTVMFYGAQGGPGTTADVTFTGSRHVVEDVDLDGYDDIVTRGTSSITVYLGASPDPDTTVDYTLNAGATLYDMDAGDINGDGYIDIVGQGGVNPNYKHYVFKGASDGWSTSNLHQVDANWGNFEVGDVNKDGYEDIVESAWISGSTYQLKVFYGSSSWPTTPDFTKTSRYSYGIKIAIPVGDGGTRAYRGTFTTQDINLPLGKKWDIVDLVGSTPQNTTMTLSVLDSSGPVSSITPHLPSTASWSSGWTR
jgi:hypothetical protein